MFRVQTPELYAQLQKVFAGAALARSRTAPPSTLLDAPLSDFANPTVLSTLTGTAFLEELAGDPSSPASTATGMPPLHSQSQVYTQVKFPNTDKSSPFCMLTTTQNTYSSLSLRYWSKL